MSTRWFVEVSPVEADTLKERYCVDALQWQQALQQARKLRADRGPLSRFAIELLDVGYRATDPTARLRYTVSKAPEDAPLTRNAAAPAAAAASSAAASAPPKAADPVAPPPVALPGPAEAPAGVVPLARLVPTPAVPAAVVEPVPPAFPAPVAPPGPPAGASQRPSQIPLPRAHDARSRSAGPGPSASAAPGVPRPSRGEVPAAAAAVATSGQTEAAAARAVTDNTVPIQLVAQKPVAAAAPVARPDPLAVPDAAPSEAATSSQDEPVPSLPGLDLISQRREEPRAGNPITYREYAFCVAPGLSPRETERYVRAIWEQVRTSLAPRPQGKLVQIALFDHRFTGKPSRPPIGVLSWKDWRGDPHLQIQGMPQATAPESLVPTPGAFPAPTTPAAAAPPPMEAAGAAAPAAPGPTATPLSAPPPPPPAAAIVPVEEPTNPEESDSAPVSSEGPALAVQELSAEEILALGIGPSSMPPRSAPPASIPAIPDAAPSPPDAVTAPAAPAAMELPRLPAPQIVVPAGGAPSEPPPARRGSLAPVPKGMRRRGPGEDLIGDLFEEMHQLRFMPDLAAGAEYVLHALLRILPSEGALVHVFDINARQFVIVRAAGPAAGDTLLLRTPDTFPLFREAFRRSRSVVFREIPEDDRYRGGRLDALGLHVKMALCGPVHQGGRYLGVIELLNPLGGTAFHEGEVNAVDYVCEQFAEFVASRPVVLDADAIIPKA